MPLTLGGQRLRRQTCELLRAGLLAKYSDEKSWQGIAARTGESAIAERSAIQNLPATDSHMPLPSISRAY